MPSKSPSQARMMGALLARSEWINDCLVWQGALDGSGYGAIKFEGILYKVHRLGFFCHTGEQPKLSVLHRCDNKPCWAEEHLFEGTQQDNVDDMIAKGRDHFINPPIGSNNGGARLNEEKVIAIKQLLRTDCTQAHIARLYGVNITTINKIYKGRSWLHVKEMEHAV